MRNFSHIKRIVIKIGTNTLSKGDRVDDKYIKQVSEQIVSLLKTGKQVVIVTSGAIGMGAGQLKIAGVVQGTEMRQACAAIGQPLLMQEYRTAFSSHGVTIAQVLLTAEVLNHRSTYLNLRNSIETLLKLGVVPVLNENDSVSTEEIGSAFGDNDTLSALVASKIDADLLIMLSDIDALYDKDPRKHTDAEPVKEVYEITDKIVRSAGKQGSKHATGGMKTKIAAAKIASYAGCRIVLCNGREDSIITRVLAGEEIGTVFMPKHKGRLSNRARWILNSAAAGTVTIDSGAMDAVRRHKSLLPSGVVSVKGTFEAGTVVMLNDSAKAVTSLGSAELQTMTGKHSSEIRQILGAKRKDVVATPEDIVFLDY